MLATETSAISAAGATVEASAAREKIGQSVMLDPMCRSRGVYSPTSWPSTLMVWAAAKWPTDSRAAVRRERIEDMVCHVESDASAADGRMVRRGRSRRGDEVASSIYVKPRRLVFGGHQQRWRGEVVETEMSNGTLDGHTVGRLDEAAGRPRTSGHHILLGDKTQRGHGLAMPRTGSNMGRRGMATDSGDLVNNSVAVRSGDDTALRIAVGQSNPHRGREAGNVCRARSRTMLFSETRPRGKGQKRVDY